MYYIFYFVQINMDEDAKTYPFEIASSSRGLDLLDFAGVVPERLIVRTLIVIKKTCTCTLHGVYTVSWRPHGFSSYFGQNRVRVSDCNFLLFSVMYATSSRLCSLMTSRFPFMVTWLPSYGRDASSHDILVQTANIFIECRNNDIFRNLIWWPPPS